MSSWTERMHRRAATLGTVVTCGYHTVPYPRRLEKVKFGIPLDQVCKNDIPGPLLVLVLKLNKEAPFKKDVFRAPGHQANMKKLVHFLQNGRLVNLDNFSVYTIASVLKKFLRKLPDGIFGKQGEQRLFQIIEMDNTEQQRDAIHRLIMSLPVFTQHLLVLLFGTFRVIATNAERSRTGMTSEALGVSVAPSFFQSCVSNGKQAKMEDVMRFKVATRIMRFLIDNFGVSNLFGRENYEYYARITGRILKVEEDWIFSFRYPPDSVVSRQVSAEAQTNWLQFESERWGLKFNLEAMAAQEETQSTPALLHMQDCEGIVPENNLRESCTRLSASLGENGLFKVHERQTARMRTRSEWFLSPSPLAEGLFMPLDDDDEASFYVLRGESLANTSKAAPPTAVTVQESPGLAIAASEVTIKQRALVRRSSSKDKERRLVRRSSSKKNKENGSGTVPQRPVTEQDCTETDVQTFHVTLTYKPRI